jgi:energy-coupling factor transporter ATP-binding protein EcfA2/predicted RNA-binding Zn-ribbon protein involved in translation (DUF1610 family)
MSDFPWSLDKTSKKYECPQCGKKKFVRYVTKDGVLMDSQYGRCDRQDSCGYHKTPEVIKENTTEYQKTVKEAPVDRDKAAKIIQDRSSNFHTFFGQLLAVKPEHWTKWCVGTDGRYTAFGLVSRDKKIVNIKRIPYGVDAKRIKNNHQGPPAFYERAPEGFKHVKCFYGEHDFKKERDTCIVEAEKNAVIGSWLFPEFNWLATGGNSGVLFESYSIFNGYEKNIYFLRDADQAGQKNTTSKWLEQIAANQNPKSLRRIYFVDDTSLPNGWDFMDRIQKGDQYDVPAKISAFKKEVQHSGQFTMDYEEVKKSKTPITSVNMTEKFEEMEGYFDKGFPQGKGTGIDLLNGIVRWRAKGGLYAWTGYPGSGKSELVKYLATLKLNLYKDKVSMLASEEDFHELQDSLIRMHLGKTTDKDSKRRVKKATWVKAYKEWLIPNWDIIANDGIVDLKKLLDYWQTLIPKGFRTFIIDPFNYVAESTMEGRDISTRLKYSLSLLKVFAHRNEVDVIVVEHPKNPAPDKNGKLPRVKAWHINGGAMFNNKCDFIGAITNNGDYSVTIESLKVKGQRYNGKRGEKDMWYEFMTGRYLESDPKSNKESETKVKDWFEKDGGPIPEDSQIFTENKQDDPF